MYDVSYMIRREVGDRHMRASVCSRGFRELEDGLISLASGMRSTEKRYLSSHS